MCTWIICPGPGKCCTADAAQVWLWCLWNSYYSHLPSFLLDNFFYYAKTSDSFREYIALLEPYFLKPLRCPWTCFNSVDVSAGMSGSEFLNFLLYHPDVLSYKLLKYYTFLPLPEGLNTSQRNQQNVRDYIFDRTSSHKAEALSERNLQCPGWVSTLHHDAGTGWKWSVL